MKRKANRQEAILTMMLVLGLLLAGCGRKDAAPAPSEPVAQSETVSPAETAVSSEAEIIIGRQDGERFEEVILLEGMEEKVRYEHVRNVAVGIEMDYDYESFIRQSDAERERFVPVWENAEDPEIWLEVTASPENAETVASSVEEALENEYDTIREAITLDRAGSCIRIDASNDKGNGETPDRLQTVTIIPAPDGCRVAAAHYSFESAEGFGRRFSSILNTLAVIDRKEAGGA